MEFTENTVDMAFDGAFTDHKALGNMCVRQPPRNQQEHFTFAFTQRLVEQISLPGRSLHFMNKMRGNVWMQDSFSARGFSVTFVFIDQVELEGFIGVGNVRVFENKRSIKLACPMNHWTPLAFVGGGSSSITLIFSLFVESPFPYSMYPRMTLELAF